MNTETLMTRSMRVGSRFTCALLAAAAMTASASAQPQGPSGDRPPLQGPRVRDDRPPGAGGRFGDASMENARYAPRPVPLPLFFEAIETLDQPETPDALRLTQTQRERLDALKHEHREGMRRKIEDRVGRGRGIGDARPDEPGLDEGPERRARRAPRDAEAADRERPGDGEGRRERVRRPAEPPARGGDAEQPRRTLEGRGSPEQIRERVREMPPEARKERMEALQAEQAEVQKNAWAVLNESQQTLVEAELERMRAELDERMLERRAEQRVRERRGEGFGADPDKASPGERPKRAAEMPREERRRAIERTRDRDGRTNEQGRERAPKDQKPAPRPD